MINFFWKKIYRGLLPEKMRNRATPFFINRFSAIFGKKGLEEHKASFGTLNKDKIFYVIRLAYPDFGLFAILSTVMDNLQYARKKGWIPVVDGKNYYSPLIQDYEKKMKYNVWEAYFQPLSEYGIDEVLQSKRVVFSSLVCEPYCGVRASGYGDLDDAKINYLGGIFRKCIRINPEILKEAEKFMKNNFKNKKILGVAYRSEFKKHEELKDALSYSHAKQGNIGEYFQDIEEWMVHGSYDGIFLSVDGREGYHIFKGRYKEKCITYDRKLLRWDKYDPNDKYAVFEEFDYDKAHGHRTDIESESKKYMIETILLSRCDGLIASMSGCVKAALILNAGKYQRKKIYHSGEMGNM